MTKFYYDPESKGFYQNDFHAKIPKTAIEITDKLRWELIAGQADGKQITVNIDQVSLQVRKVDLYELTFLERDWRDMELVRSDIELNKVQDSDPKSSGSVSDWRSYRKALRAWPEQSNFPNKEFRPKAPDAE